MGKAMKFLQPVIGGLETAGGVGLTIAGAPEVGVPLAVGGLGTLGTGIAGAVQKPPSLSSPAPTIPTLGPRPAPIGNNLDTLAGSLSPTSPTGMDSGGGATFGSIIGGGGGVGDLQSLLSMILQGSAGGTL